MEDQQEAAQNPSSPSRVAGAGTSLAALPKAYRRACRLAGRGQYKLARRLYAKLKPKAGETRLESLIANDLAVLAALEGRFEEARQGWRAALALDSDCVPARLNCDLAQEEVDVVEQGSPHAPSPDDEKFEGCLAAPGTVVPSVPRPSHPDVPSTKVSILSFLFNWPSTGGGNVHTVELAWFLSRAGFEVRHVYARYPDWGIGRVEDALQIESEALEFNPSSWNVAEIQARYRRAVESFDPDYVLIADAWNMKPLLAEAMEGYPYFLRFQAQECLCPLNNLRLLARGPQTLEQCPRNQLATPEVCHRCLVEHGHQSGSLHQWERELCRVGTPEYDRKLRRAMENAEAVLVLNPLIGALVEPYARSVRVVPWGMDPARFPWPPPEQGGAGRLGTSEGEVGRPAPSARPTASAGEEGGVGRPSTQEGGVGRPSPSADRPPPSAEGPARSAVLFMAAVASEFIKGFHVAHEACRILRRTRSDFELVVTFDPPGPGRIDEFTRSVGWCLQADLPRHYRAADICLVPAIAQEGLSRTSVEAMASGIPVIASRIGGLPFTVSDGSTGLLCEPGDPADLARQIARLLDDPPLRRRMGLAGRQRFEEEFTWETVIERYYRPLLVPRRVGRNGNGRR